MIYAVVKSGGKQHRVAVGDKIKVEKIPQEIGDKFHFNSVLFVADGEELHTVNLDNVKVEGKVIDHGKKKKITVFKMKRRKGYRRTQGHRQQFTEIEVTRIQVASNDVSSSKNKESK